MKFKKNWKRFWTLNRHHAEGFTLVELIVVIAILAILGGVAVPAYSGYVEKANKTADIALASEVAHALTLYSYSNPGTAGGYVTITKDGTTASTPEMEAAMTAVFGEGWQQNDALALKADWAEASGSSMLSYALANADKAQTVANSTFLTDASTDGMLNALTTLTNIATKVINGHEDRAVNILNNMGLSDVADKLTALEEDGLTSTDPNYATTISNLLVGHFSGNMNETNINTNDSLEELAMTYATFYAYSEYVGDTSAMDTINAKLQETDDVNELTAANLFAGVDTDLYTGYVGYMEEMDSKGIDNQAAFLEMMGAMNQVSNSYTDAESLGNPDLYNSESVKNQVNDYVNAIKTIAGMDDGTLAKLKENVGNGSVVVSLADGVVVVSPTLS